ncbi:hypothetical protein KOW79_005356 [Hemibagrus wyckioides]|uniref:MORC family CW-type zinc finger protein 3 n=1 Tax=Hemibagrus wyckioides TaxID=337641 RepID=A0A9D3SP71_9TELE|nr:hypothetical protein KOW79_005356 [Hemibagrus wyckioides]
MAAQTTRGIPLSAVCPRYLHTNSTSHTGPFSAIAELIDNAYDPDVSAKQFWIDKTVIKGQDCLIFMDNGNGMDYDKMHKMLSFGFSDKQTVKGHAPVGLYGNGFKSGSMRLGKDAIVFSKQADTMCVGLLSQTYLERTGAKNVIVPVVKFTNAEHNILYYEECLHDILTYSLFNIKEELLIEFQAINGPCGVDSSGTRIIIWNLHKTSSGELEFDFMKDRYDIRLPIDINDCSKESNKGPEIEISPPQSEYSLRAYTSILYLKPRMQIIVCGKKVKTQLVSKSLAHIIKDTYKPTFLKKGIKITFGYNTGNKEHYGLMMYYKNRLIKAYEPVACQRKANKTGVGVIGVIECNYLNPMHNKQDFEKTEEYRKTIQNVSTKLEEYWKEIRHRRNKIHCTVPVEDDVKKPDQNWVQCDECMRWRKLPDCIDVLCLPEKWFCRMNPDPQFRSCAVEEEPEDSDDEAPRNQKTYKQDERTKKLQQKKRKQSLVNPRSSMPVTPRPSNDASVVILDKSLSTTPKRKKKALDLSQEKSEKKARRKCFDNYIPEFPALISSNPDTADWKDFKPALNDNSDVFSLSLSDEQSFKSTDSVFVDQQNVKVLYLQVMETTRQLQDKLRELKKGLTEMDSLEYEKLTNCCESLQKDLEEIKREIEKVKVTDEDYAAPLKEASNPGREKDSQFRTWKDETQDISESLRFEELRQRMARLLVTFVPALDLEKVINQILSHDIDEISTTDLSLGKGSCTIPTQHSNTKYHTEATDVFTPELLQHCADSGAYRFLCSHAGVFSCKLTNISFDMKRSGEVLYTVESWDNSQLQGMGQFKPAGPLYNIDCSEDSILYLHLPHCEIHTDKNKLELAVAHFSEDNVEIIQPLNITSTHVIFEVHGLSIFGLLKKWIFSENPISAQVLLFYKEIIGNERRRKLHIHLLPGNVPVDKVQEQHQCNTYIQCSSICILTPGKKYRPHCEPYVSQPKVERFGCDFGPNYHPTFEVILNAEVENLTLGLLDETDQEVWEPRQVFLTDESREEVPVEMNEGAAFVDKHRDTLIQRDLPVLEIADTLLTKKHITREMNNEINEATTTQNKMRILYRHLNSRAAKAEFYKILKEKQPDVVDELNLRSNNA